MGNVLISVITPTLNNEKDLKSFFESIRNQDFPNNKLEILIMDGGSTDNTVSLAKKYKARVIYNKEVFADAGVNLGMLKAKGEIRMVLATDNLYNDKKAFTKIAKVFEDKDIYAAFPKQVSLKSDTVFTKYVNNFTDPLNHFVYGYAANPRTFHKVFEVKEENDIFTVFDFKTKKSTPLIAFAQGFCVRAGFKRSSKNAFDDVAPVLELIEKNKQIAYIHSVSLVHHTINGLGHFVDKQAWRTKNFVDGRSFGISYRRNILSKSQARRLTIWPFYSLTLLPPFLYSSYHLVKDRESLWIFHPFLCIISAYTSAFTVVRLSLAGKIR